MYDNQREPVRKTILIRLDVMVSEENEDYLEAEITHPRLSGALYLSVNCRKELNEELDRVDISDMGIEERSTSSSGSEPIRLGCSTPPSVPQSTVMPTSTGGVHPVESLIKNSFKFADTLTEFSAKLKRKR